MPRPLSNDLRARLVQAVESGLSRRSVAKRFDVSASAVIKLLDQWNRTGSFEPLPLGGDRKTQKIEQHAPEILGLIEQTPDITLAEIAAHLQETHQVKVSESMVWRLIDRHGWSFKKNRSRQRTATA